VLFVCQILGPGVVLQEHREVFGAELVARNSSMPTSACPRVIDTVNGRILSCHKSSLDSYLDRAGLIVMSSTTLPWPAASSAILSTVFFSSSVRTGPFRRTFPL